MSLSSHSERAEREYLEGLRYEDKFPDEGEVSGMGLIARDELVQRIVEVLDREDPGGQPTIVAAAIAAAIVEDSDAKAEQLRGAVARFAKIETLIADHFATPGGSTLSLQEARQLAANAPRALAGGR